MVLWLNASETHMSLFQKTSPFVTPYHGRVANLSPPPFSPWPDWNEPRALRMLIGCSDICFLHQQRRKGGKYGSRKKNETKVWIQTERACILWIQLALLTITAYHKVKQGRNRIG
jgi:hypothetical protein